MGRGLDQGRKRWDGVMSVRGVSLDSRCRWQVQISVYCAWRIPAHLRRTQCSILLHLMDISFLTCICLWQISQIQTFLFKVGLDITRFCEQQRRPSSGSAWPACPKNGNSGPLCCGWGGSTQFAQQFESFGALYLYSLLPSYLKKRVYTVVNVHMSRRPIPFLVAVGVVLCQMPS